MESLPAYLLQSILCRGPLRDVFKLKAASPKLNNLIDFSFVREVSELAKGVYWQNRSPAFAVSVGVESDDDRENRFRIFVVDTKGNVYDYTMPVVRGSMKVETTCKGLVLVSVTSFSEREIKHKGRKSLFVFNLSSGSSVEIPPTPRHCSPDGADDCSECLNWYSMGFDVETSVCTIIRITTHHSLLMTLIDIYSSETRQWRTCDFPLMITGPYSPMYSKGSFFFPYTHYPGEDTRVGVFTPEDCTFISFALPTGDGGEDHSQRFRWTFHGREDHLTLIYQNNFIFVNPSRSRRSRRDNCWNFKEEALFLTTAIPDEDSIVSSDVNCWEKCNPRTTELVELGNTIQSEKDVFSEGEADYTLDYDARHLGITSSWKDRPDDKFRVYNVKGEVVNRLTLTHLRLPPIVDENEVPERWMSHFIRAWPLEINNIAWPWPKRDCQAIR